MESVCGIWIGLPFIFRSALMPLDVGNILVLYICLHCLECLCIPDTVTGVLIELFLICNYTLLELMHPPELPASHLVRFQWWVPAVGACHFASNPHQTASISRYVGQNTNELATEILVVHKSSQISG